MAKIYYCILGVFLFLYSCSRGVPASGIETKKDSAIADIPVMVDTTYADTVSIVPEVVVIDTVIEKTDTVKEVIVIEEKQFPDLQSVYTSQIGVREKTGKNDGPEVRKYMATVGLGEGYPWCAGFVKWCFLEAGYTSVKSMNGMALSTVNKKNIVFENSKKIKKVQAGDVFTLYYASLKRIGHTGFVDKEINSSIFESVEGNTNSAGSREGDGVYRKKRSYNATHNISRWSK